MQERKKKVQITVESGGKPLPDAELSVEWVAKGFPLGNAMTKEILDMPEYEEWFAKRFKWATMENEMKWYSTEFHEGQAGFTFSFFFRIPPFAGNEISAEISPNFANSERKENSNSKNEISVISTGK